MAVMVGQRQKLITIVQVYHKRRKFGGILVWRIKEICQTLICQLATFILLIIGCTVNLPYFLPPTCFKRRFVKLKSHQTFVFYGITAWLFWLGYTLCMEYTTYSLVHINFAHWLAFMRNTPCFAHYIWFKISNFLFSMYICIINPQSTHIGTPKYPRNTLGHFLTLFCTAM